MAFRKKFRPRKKVCRFCQEGVAQLDYKNIELLQDFVTARGKIIARRITGTCAKHQRQVTREIKRARQMALLYYTTTHSTEVKKKTV